ncbi:MAG: hypothetical protein ABIO39_05845 [Caulobacteraceae bacterium]
MGADAVFELPRGEAASPAASDAVGKLAWPAATPRRLPLGIQVLLAILAVSNGLFLIRAAATPWFAAGCCLAVVAGLAVLFPRRESVFVGNPPWTTGCILLALVLSILGGAGHLMFTSEDWIGRDAVLGDVTKGAWPVVYDWDGANWFLRAPLGFYEIPGAIGALFGLKAAHMAVLVQNTAMLAAVLALFVREVDGRWRRLTLLAVFLLFSGLDIIGIAKDWGLAKVQGYPFPFPMHIERWAGDLEYSSMLTDLFWAPNHGLPAFGFVAAYLCWRRKECSAAGLAAFAALAFFWSPLAAVGMAPFVLYALYRDLVQRDLRLVALVAAGAVGVAMLPAVLFLHLGSGSVPHGLLLTKPGYPLRYVVFGLHEILPALYLMLRAGHGDHKFSKAELAIVAAMLLAAPLYMMGASNDFMMRASIVPLAMAALVIGERLISCIDQRQFKPMTAILVVLAIGAVTPGLEIARALIHRATPPGTEDVPRTWVVSPFSWAPPDTYLAPLDALKPWPWLFKPAPPPAQK